MTTAAGQYDVKLSSSLFAFHRQTHPPTGVEYSVYCQFYGPHEKNLVIAGGSVLKVHLSSLLLRVLAAVIRIIVVNRVFRNNLINKKN